MYPYEENALCLLILTVFLVRVHFFYSFFLFIRFQKSKKSVPLRGTCTFFTNFDCFPRKGTLFLTLFYHFSDFKSVKKVYPYEENAFFLLILTVFLVRVHFFYSFFHLSDFKRVKKVYPYEENALCLLILTVFLVRVHFFYSFFLFIRFQKSKKSVPLRGTCTFFTNFDCFPRKGTLFFTLFYYFSDFKRVKKVSPYEENAFFLLILTVFLVRVHFFYSFEIWKKKCTWKKIVKKKCEKSVPGKKSVKKVYQEKK